MDVDQFRIPNDQHTNYEPPQNRTRLPRIKGPFLLGPVPIVWLQKAMKLSCAALSVGIILWHLHGMKKSFRFKVGIRDLAKYVGKSWPTCQRALQSLEEHGLIALEKNNGRKHIVTILEVEERNGQEASLGL